MDSSQLRHIMKNDRLGRVYFKDVYAADHARNQVVNTYPSGCIINTDPSDKSGTHWVCFYVTGTASNSLGEFFCSYGEPPESYNFKSWIENSVTSWTYNKKRLQGEASSVCGHYCLFYLLHRFRNVSTRTIQDMFTRDFDLNDAWVNKFINDRFNIDTPIIDVDMIVKQISRALSKM